MIKKFTKEMTDILNEMLSDKWCIIRFKLETKDINGEELYNPHLKIVPAIETFIDSYIFNLNERFYIWLEQFCKDRWNVTLSYNNTKNIIWTNEGFNIEETNNGK
jgi:hypothetical protein